MHLVRFRFASPADEEACRRLDRHWPRSSFAGKIAAQELILVESHTEGIGKAVLAFLEDHLRQHGHRMLLSSSQANEADPQAWHRAVGFRECGILAGINEGGIGEVFFRKDL